MGDRRDERPFLETIPSAPRDVQPTRQVPQRTAGAVFWGIYPVRTRTGGASARAASAPRTQGTPEEARRTRATVQAQSSRDIRSRSFPDFLLTTVATVVKPAFR